VTTDLQKQTQLSAQNEQKAREKQGCLHRCNGTATNSIRDTFWELAILVMQYQCGYRRYFFPYFLTIFDTNIFVVRGTSQVYINNNITVTEKVKSRTVVLHLK